MLSENVLFDSPDLGVFSRQELNQVEEARLVLSLIMVPVLDLALQGCKYYGFFTSTRVSPINDGIFGLDHKGEGWKGGT